MTPTAELREELRRLTDERIPTGGSAAQTRFSDVELDILLTAASHINAAASAGWAIKASRAMSERGGLQESQAGDEKHKFVTLEAYRDHCLMMAHKYEGMSPQTGSRVFQYEMVEL